MKAELINPFITSSIEILTLELNSEPQRGKLALVDAIWTTQEVTVIIPIVGPVEGTFQLGLSQKVAVNITSRMMGEELTEFNKWVVSAMGELGNIIAGRALAKLEVIGYLTDIGPPTVLYGARARISTLDRQKLQIPMETETGLIEVSVCLREKKKQT